MPRAERDERQRHLKHPIFHQVALPYFRRHFIDLGHSHALVKARGGVLIIDIEPEALLYGVACRFGDS